MEEADTDASDVDSSAEAQPRGMQEPPAATGSQEVSEDDNRTPKTGDEGREALPASAVSGHVIGGNRRRFLRVDENAICRYYMRHNGKRTASCG